MHHKDVSQADLTEGSAPELQKKLIDGLHAVVGSRTIDELEAERDEILLGLLELRSRRPDARREVAAE